jgi:opacity protein-like surface antigen
MCTSVQAQEIPAWEISAGYSDLVGHLIHPRFHLNGVDASLEGNLNDWFGIKLDFSAYSGPPSEINNMSGNPSAQTFTLGPVFSLRRYKRFTPFGQIGIGAAHGSQSGSHGYIAPSESSTAFAASAGGGVDFRLNKWAGIRLQGNYLTTTFLAPSGSFWNSNVSPRNGNTQGNLQILAGIVIRIGTRQPLHSKP